MPGPGNGPVTLGRGTWPDQTFDHIDDFAIRESGETTLRLVTRLREGMDRNVLSERQVAFRAGIDPVTLKNLLDGRHFPRLDYVVRLIQIADGDLEGLLQPAKLPATTHPADFH